jgi:CheY-like chemotaxis protein
MIESDLDKRKAIMAALAGPDRAFDTVASAAEALAALRNRAYQGVVMELDLPGQDGLTLLQQIRSDPQLAAIPAVLYSERELDAGTLEKVRLLDATVVGEGQLLVDQPAEVALFLQRVKSRIPAPPQPPPSATATVTMEADDAAHEVLHGKCVLIVDDDARNLFALTGLLENYSMNVIAVENGEEAIKQLETHGDIDIVLMDIMMPDMFGYVTTRRIRADTRFAKLPIIALTAKAMSEDRTKCLAAGASDYASKPVDTRQLLAQLSVWLAAGGRAS